MRPMRSAIILAAALAAISCADSTAPAGLAMTVSLDQDRVAMDDSVLVTLRIANVSSSPKTVTTPESYGMCMHAFRVVTRDRREVNVHEFLCALVSMIAPQPLVLAPGASVTARDYWKPGESTIDGRPISADVYALMGRYLVADGVLESRPFSVEVLP